ncbi:PilZ-like domain-containing protein [Geotalea toluenoxydans]|uniref:PilZ-like domain-containing protein n=1 Tax=Geotalea toluenoxydans TaxID=421624 RepID=UPI000A4F5F56|nr:PilZ-like domain-containing protein [Geotalea toluenoxydans]
MSEQNLYYWDYFHVNQRARVDLPLGNGRFFHEWAVINFAHGDLITLRLSRDVLPHDLLLAKGEPVSVRAGSGGQGYRCHAVIEDVELEKVTLRLSGSVIPDELRLISAWIHCWSLTIFLPARKKPGNCPAIAALSAPEQAVQNRHHCSGTFSAPDSWKCAMTRETAKVMLPSPSSSILVVAD